MKIRNGFVSNSSSTSFTCDFCNREDGGMEACLSDVRMVECLDGHYICDDHVSFGDTDGDREEFPSDECPCCNLEVVCDYLVTAYLLHLAGRDKSSVVNEIKEKFSTENDFWKEIRGEST